MQNEMNNFDNKLNNNYIKMMRPKTEITKKTVFLDKPKNNKNNNLNINQKPNYNNQFINKNNNHNINQNNNKINKTKIGKTFGKMTKIKKIAQNFGNFNYYNYNRINDYNYNLNYGMEKQYTPVLKNENDIFQFYNYNIKGSNIKNNNDEKMNLHKRCKSSSKPTIRMEPIKNKKINKPNNDFNIKDKKNPTLINKNKKEFIKRRDYSPKQNKNNIRYSNLSPNKKIILPINSNSNKFPNEKKIQNKNIIKNNNINIYQEKNNIIINKDNTLKKNHNNQINLQTQSYFSYGITEHPNPENRQEMEDFHDFKNLYVQNILFSYFAIFDGHGGPQVAIFLRDNFHKYLLDELKLITFTNDSELNNKTIILSINNTFAKIDNDIMNNKKIKNNNGSTGTIILLFRNPLNHFQRIIICANVGDSKGFIINKNNIQKITKDHICSDDNETNRIRSKGGVVFNGRVFGMLMITRSFGDKEFKQYGVLPTPNIFLSQIEDNNIYAVIASDGVWDTISEEDLFKLSKSKMSSEELSKKIVGTTMERGSRDNVSCCVVKLNSGN